MKIIKVLPIMISLLGCTQLTAEQRIKLDAQVTCNSVLPQKYPKMQVIKKYNMVRTGDHWTWRWKTNFGLAECRVWDNGKYQIN